MNEKEKRIPVNMRLLPADLETIDKRAEAAHISRTEYIVRCCTGDESTDRRLGALVRAASIEKKEHESIRGLVRIDVCLTVTLIMIVVLGGAVLLSKLAK